VGGRGRDRDAERDRVYEAAKRHWGGGVSFCISIWAQIDIDEMLLNSSFTLMLEAVCFISDGQSY